MASKNDEQDLGEDGSVTLRPVSALVPDQVSRGVFSTGVIAITGNTEFILDFVLVVGTPSTVVSRVICTHEALRRIVAAMRRNVESFSSRGDAASIGRGGETTHRASPLGVSQSNAGNEQYPSSIGTEQFVGASIPVPADASVSQPLAGDATAESGSDSRSSVARQNPLDLYDDMTVPDAVQAGVYANGLIIGHTDSEFKLDFVSNMFPKSVVTSRIFMSAPQLVRLLDTLERTLFQFDQKRDA